MTDLPKREEVVKRRVRFVVPAREPWGLPIKDLQLAIRHALDDRERRGLSNEYDDALRFVAEDGDGGEIVIFYDVEEPARQRAASSRRLAACPHVDEYTFTVQWPTTVGFLRSMEHTVKAMADCCHRDACQQMLAATIEEITGHRGVAEPYATP